MSEASARLRAVGEGVAAAARAAGRDPRDVTLVAVSKGRTDAEIEALIAAGQRDFGENRIQEAVDKWPALLARYPGLTLHYIGRLQSNKALDAVRLFDVIQSLDRPSLVEAIAAASGREARQPRLFVQVNVGEEEQKGGCDLSELSALVEQARGAGLDVEGLMAIPPLGVEPGPFFALLAKTAKSVSLGGLSMGMSGDYRTAVMLGATMVRVGSALFE